MKEMTRHRREVQHILNISMNKKTLPKQLRIEVESTTLKCRHGINDWALLLSIEHENIGMNLQTMTKTAKLGSSGYYIISV